MKIWPPLVVYPHLPVCSWGELVSYEDGGRGNRERNMGEDSERAARQTGGGVTWQNIWRLTAGMCQNRSMNNWKGTEKETERYRERIRVGVNRNWVGEPWSSLSPISLSGLSLSSIDQIKFLLAAYSSRALWRSSSTPSLGRPIWHACASRGSFSTFKHRELHF